MLQTYRFLQNESDFALILPYKLLGTRNMGTAMHHSRPRSVNIVSILCIYLFFEKPHNSSFNVKLAIKTDFIVKPSVTVHYNLTCFMSVVSLVWFDLFYEIVTAGVVFTFRLSSIEILFKFMIPVKTKTDR